MPRMHLWEHFFFRLMFLLSPSSKTSWEEAVDKVSSTKYYRIRCWTPWKKPFLEIWSFKMPEQPSRYASFGSIASFQFHLHHMNMSIINFNGFFSEMFPFQRWTTAEHLLTMECHDHRWSALEFQYGNILSINRVQNPLKGKNHSIKNGCSVALIKQDGRIPLKFFRPQFFWEVPFTRKKKEKSIFLIKLEHPLHTLM